MSTRFDTFKGHIDRYQIRFILLVSALCLSLFLPIWNFLGHGRGDFNLALTLYIFPIFGFFSLIAAGLGPKFGLFLFGLALVFAFPLTLAVGSALFGP